MKRVALTAVLAALLGAPATEPTLAQGRGDWHFQRVGTFANFLNASIDETTVAEIVATTADGNTLVYTDAGRGTIGFIDITNPAAPRPGGSLALDPDPSDEVTYSPTSVAVLRNKYVLVAVDTSASKIDGCWPASRC